MKYTIALSLLFVPAHASVINDINLVSTNQYTQTDRGYENDLGGWVTIYQSLFNPNVILAPGPNPSNYGDPVTIELPETPAFPAPMLPPPVLGPAPEWPRSPGVPQPAPAPAPIPEPGTAALTAAALLCVCAFRRLRRS